MQVFRQSKLRIKKLRLIRFFCYHLKNKHELENEKNNKNKTKTKTKKKNQKNTQGWSWSRSMWLSRVISINMITAYLFVKGQSLIQEGNLPHLFRGFFLSEENLNITPSWSLEFLDCTRRNASNDRSLCGHWLSPLQSIEN